MEQENANSNEVIHTEEVQEVSSTPQVVSLDALDEFEFQGHKMSPDHLHKVLTDYNDMTSGRDSYAKNAHFYANLPHDLKTVAANPALAEKFKETYPREFHDYLDVVLKKTAEKTQVDQESQNQKVSDPELLELKRTVSRLESMLNSKASQESLSELNSTVDPLLQKYPLAVEETVLLEAEAMVAKGMKVTKDTWERLVKRSHEQMSTRSREYMQNELKQKKDALRKAKDSGQGGSAMGNEGPKKPRTFDEAQEAMIKHYSNKNRG